MNEPLTKNGPEIRDWRLFSQSLTSNNQVLYLQESPRIYNPTTDNEDGYIIPDT
jgi:hypothetical protein